MAFGLTADGFFIKRLADIKLEIEQRFKDEFGDEIDLRPATPEGTIIGIMAEREAALWELAQADYDSKNPTKAVGKQLDDVVEITGTTRTGALNSSIDDGVARGDENTVIDPSVADFIVSVEGDPLARFKVTNGPYILDIDDGGGIFKSGPITLISEETGEIVANTGTLTIIETPLGGVNSFTNESDATLGAPIESDPDLKLKRNTELQIAGSATIDAIIAELSARELTTATIVFENKTSIEDLEGRPPKSLDIVVLGDDEQDLADAIFKVVGGGIETIGDIIKTTLDSEGFSHITKFSRATEIDIWIELDLTVDGNYPGDGDVQVENALLAYGELQNIGQDVIVFGSKPLICAFEDIPGILDVVLRIGKAVNPTENDNIIIAAREQADFDSARITIVSV